MVLGVAPRIRVRASLPPILPAVVLLGVNAYIFLRALELQRGVGAG